MLLSIHAKAQSADSFAIVSSTATIPVVKQTSPYKIKPWLDIPLAVAFDAWSFYGMSVIYGRDAIPVAEILGLDKNNVNSFDRPITGNYSLSAKAASDKFFLWQYALTTFTVTR